MRFRFMVEIAMLLTMRSYSIRGMAFFHVQVFCHNFIMADHSFLSDQLIF